MAFETVVDMQVDAGCDPTGTEPCDAALEAAVDDDVLVEFPPGRYRFEQEHRFDEIANLGIVGRGQHRHDVEFVFPSGYSGIFLGLWNGEHWLLENLTVQQSMDGETGVGIVLVARRGLRMRDVEIAGFSPYNTEGGQRGLYCVVLEPDGTGLIERYARTGPSAVGNYPQGTQAFLTDEHHRGTLYCRDWRLENAGENGIYASRTPGRVRVEGGRFRNNDVASIRVCGEGSYIRDATVVIDTDNAHPRNTGTYDNTRGIWWESGTLAKSGGFIENCDLVMRSTAESQGLLRIERTAGSVSVRNCRLVNETSWSTVGVVEPTPKVRRGSTRIEIEHVTVAANGTGRPALHVIGRPRSAIRDTTVRSEDADRDGVRLERARGTVIDGGELLAGRFPLHLVPGSMEQGCLARVTDRVVIRSGRFVGQLLLPVDDDRRDSDTSHVHCVPARLGVAFESLAVTSSSRRGLRGYLLGPDGRILGRTIGGASGGETGGNSPRPRLSTQEQVLTSPLELQ